MFAIADCLEEVGQQHTKSKPKSGGFQAYKIGSLGVMLYLYPNEPIWAESICLILHLR